MYRKGKSNKQEFVIVYPTFNKGERQNYVVITLKTGDSGLLVLDEITPVDYDTSFSSVLIIERI